MKALIVHDSDGIFDCFIGETEDEILIKVLNSKHGEDIMNRLNDDDEKEIDKTDVTMEQVTSLYHDGDSECGYTLVEAI